VDEQLRDNRPAVYSVGDRWVYRVSSLGGCEQALRYARAGKGQSPVPKKLQAAYDSSAALEQPIIDAFTKEYQVVVEGRQKRGTIQVNDAAVIVGSCDGIGRPEDLGGGNAGLVEVKAFGPDFTRAWLGGEFASFPHYETQFHLYCAMHELQGGWMVIGEKDERGFLVGRPNGLPRLHVSWHPYRSAVVARAKATVRAVESWHTKWKAREVGWTDGAKCPATWGCAYWQEHPDDTSVVIDAGLAQRLDDREHLGKSIAMWKEDKDALSEAVAKELFDDVTAGTYIVKGSPGDAGYRVTVYEGTSTTTDFARMKTDGVDVESYQTSKPTKRSVRITKQETDNG
jgi:hypothetical protein